MPHRTPLPAPGRREQFVLNSFRAMTVPTPTAVDNGPLYYYTFTRGSAKNLTAPSLYDSQDVENLHSFRSYDDVHECQYGHGMAISHSTPWLSQSYEPNAYRPNATIYESCYSSVHRPPYPPQNLTTTFQSRSEDVWLARRSYYEEEVVIALREDVERVGFSMSGAVPGSHDATINSILPGFLPEISTFWGTLLGRMESRSFPKQSDDNHKTASPRRSSSSCSYRKSKSATSIFNSVPSTSSSTVAKYRNDTPLPGYIIFIATDRRKQRTVLFGSPAERAGLQVGDRIVEVNGCPVEGKEHSQIVRLIVQCIKSRVIQLRVRRKQETADGENPLISPEIAISDAFLVSPDKKQAHEVADTLKRNFPDIRTHDMEMLATSKSEAVDLELQVPANAETKMMNGHVKAGMNDDDDDDETMDGMMNTCTENVDESERLKNYGNDIRKRRELDEHRAREDAFLRDSLRGSKKLQSLEDHKTGTDERNEPLMHSNGTVLNGTKLETGYANSAYEAGDSSHDITVCGECEPIPLEQVLLSVNRVAEHLEKKEGREEESKLLRDFFLQEPVKQAIESTALHTKNTDVEMKPTASLTADTGGSDPMTSAAITRMHGDLKIVKVNKSTDTYLGATVRNEGEKVVVGRVVRGGMAEKSNLLKEGDELIEVNGNDLRGKNIAEVCDILRSISGELSLVVAPSDKPNGNTRPETSPVKHFRALFDYDPEDDIYVPCKELALKFQRGDILHVLSMSDENWWQAYREGDDPCTSLAGLIPSISFQQQLALYAREIERENQSEGSKRKDFFRCTRKKNSFKGKSKKGTDELKSADELSAENDAEILTYEEVSLYISKAGRKRPLVLCGPEGVGCLELRQRLAESDKDKFASAIPHTTRPRKSGEIDGVHYHFVTKHSFQEDAKAGKFIEYGEFQKYLYGTSLASIQAVIDQTKICLLTLKAENLKALRRTTFMPYVVFIAPPSLQQLRRQKEILGQHGVKDEQLKLILNEGKVTEQQYGHFFDRIIVNVDLDRSLEELKQVVKSLETEPHWVPTFWPINSSNSVSSKCDEKLIS